MNKNWQDDPELQLELYENRVRGGLVRSALIWTPIFAACFALFVFFLVDQLTGGDKGTWFLVGVLAVFSGLLGFQAAQPLLDLRSEPVEGTHTVVRRWSKSDALVMRTHYVQLANKQILHGDRYVLEGIKDDDTVVVRYYTHSGVIVNIERAKPPAEPASSVD